MIVVKLGGTVVRERLPRGLLEDFKAVSKSKGLVIVHGGGDEVTEVAEKLGSPQTFITSASGITSRLTDAETIDIYTMVMTGRVAKRVARYLLEAGLKPVTLSGLDSGLIRAVRKEKLVVEEPSGRKHIIDGGYTGTIKEVDPELVELLLKKGYIPVITPLAVGMANEPLNVDGDRAAAKVAGALKAEYLILFTDVQGVLLGQEVLRVIKLRDVTGLIQKVGQGMKMKILASLEALNANVKRVVIAPFHQTPHPLQDALDHKIGTLIEV